MSQRRCYTGQEAAPAIATPRPVSVRIGYQWLEEDLATGKKPDDVIWKFMRKEFKAVLDAVQNSSEKREHKHAFYYHLGRMRGKHGGDLCSRLLELCKNTDILAFDISTNNPNIMFELGVAVCAKGVESGRVFLFVDEKTLDKNFPSDLKGYFRTHYRRSKDGFELTDGAGFRAALRSIILEDARTRGMWGRINEIEGEELPARKAMGTK